MNRVPVALVVVTGVATVLGIVAAAFGGWWTGLGNGYGGLEGLPAGLLALAVVGVTVRATVVGIRTDRTDVASLRHVGLLVAIVWVVGLGYSEIAHQLDPCARGWWEPSSTFGDQPRCERFDDEYNVHTRYHLLWHAGPAFLLALGGLMIWRRHSVSHLEPV